MTKRSKLWEVAEGLMVLARCGGMDVSARDGQIWVKGVARNHPDSMMPSSLNRLKSLGWRWNGGCGEWIKDVDVSIWIEQIRYGKGMSALPKLVRDRIPNEIINRGATPRVHHVAGEKLRNHLIMKVREELAEFEHGYDPEELADLLEVVFALSSLVGSSPADITRMRDVKLQGLGGFLGGIILEGIDEK